LPNGKGQDAAGRLVIPAEIKRAAALEPGVPLEVRWRDGVIEIEPQPLATIVALTGAGHLALLERLATSGIGGGRSYDAVIAACASQAGMDALLAFNRRHFDPRPEGVDVVGP
jgi:bifunctional DNA-binding transcriptional regulator/antitoxin component of YhaV-PrlF toxin-antitoxin module